MRPEIKTVEELVLDQQVASSIVPVVIGSVGTGNNPFQFLLGAGKRVKWKLRGIFTLGATGGFRFRADTAQVAARYNAEYLIRQNTTPTALGDAILAEGDFANASAVAADYQINAQGIIVQGATAGLISLQFAQNTSDALPIILRAGMTFEIEQF